MPRSSKSVVTSSRPASLAVMYVERKPVRGYSAFIAFLERRAVQNPFAAAAVGLVQDDVADQVLVAEDDARVIAA